MKNFIIKIISDLKSNRKKAIILITFIFLWIFLLCISLIKVPYEILTPGAISDTTQSVKIETDNDRGKIGTVSITTYKPVSVIQYWVSKYNNKLDCIKYNPDEDLSNKDDTIYGTISKRVGINNAIIVAYEEAAKIDDSIKIEKKYSGQIISAKFPYSENSLLCDDIIIKADGISLEYDYEKNTSNFSLIISEAKKTKSSITLTIERTVVKSDNTKEKETKDVVCKFVEKDNNKYLGISTLSNFEILNATPEYSIIDQYNTIGSSGGSMLALSIYNGLISKDITNDKIVVGTGTIEIDGSIGEIGGVEQKVLTAINYGVNLFFINNNKYSDEPSNYETAILACKEHNIEYENFIIPVKKFSDIIQYLNEME